MRPVTNFGASGKMLPSEDIQKKFTNQVAHCPKDAPSRKNVPEFRFKRTSDVAYDIGEYAYFETATWFTWNSLLCL